MGTTDLLSRRCRLGPFCDFGVVVELVDWPLPAILGFREEAGRYVYQSCITEWEDDRLTTGCSGDREEAEGK
jgi:hypothetical protein